MANRNLKLQFVSVKKAKAEEEKVTTHTQVKRSGFHDLSRVKRSRQTGAEMDKDLKATT